MRYVDLQAAFETELNTFAEGITKPKSYETEYWLNVGLREYVKTRYTGLNFKRESFEQSQKRIDDLRTLVTKRIYTGKDLITDTASRYYAIMPSDYFIFLGDEVKIVPIDGDNEITECWEVDEEGEFIPKLTSTIEANIENITEKLENSLSEHHMHNGKAKPIKHLYGSVSYLYTDGRYKPVSYQIEYLRRPIRIDIHSNPFEEYTNMPMHTHDEIVRYSVKAYLENKRDPRLESYTQLMVNTME